MYQKYIQINTASVILLLIVCTASYSQTYYTSKDNQYGLWENADTWDKTQTWLPNTPSTTGGSNSSSDIYGYVWREGDLGVGGGSFLTIRDTLWVTGKLTILEGLIVEPGGVLVVGGDAEFSGGARGRIDGVMIVLGDLKMPSWMRTFDGSTGDYFVYNDSDISGPNVSDENGLANYGDGSLYDFVEGGGITTLPITLLSFEGRAATEGVILEWTTETEENFDFFTVERAGIDLQFEAIAQIEGQGGPAQVTDYNFIDEDLLEGVVYYRLKATDYDGSEEYHKVIAVLVEETKVEQRTSIFPNPVENKRMYVQAHYAASQLRLINDQGSTVFETDLQMGRNAYVIPGHLPAGYYTAVISSRKHQREELRLLIR